MTALLILVLVTLVIIAVAIILDRRERETVVRDLTAIADLVGGHVKELVVDASLSGVGVALRLTARGSGKQRQLWTEIDVALPPKYPLTMLVRRHTFRDDSKITRGEMVDIKLGDRAFDDAFLVEAAPADVMKNLLDEPVRRLLLLAFEAPTLETIPDEATLRFATHGWLRDPARAVEAMQTLASVGARVRRAYAAADEAIPARIEGGPFRETIDDAPKQDAQHARVEEVRRVEQVRADRVHNERLLAAVLVIGGAVLIAFLVMLR